MRQLLAVPLTRRALLRSATALSAGLMLDGWSWRVLTGHASAPESDEIAAVLAYLRAAKIAFQRMREFTDGDQAGMRFITHADENASDRAGLSLYFLRDALRDLRSTSAALPAPMRERTLLQFPATILGDLEAAAELYRTHLFWGTSIPGRWRESSTRQDVTRLLNMAAQHRAALEPRIGPEAALVAPLLMGLELACATRLGVDAARVRAPLAMYERWITRMQSDMPGSIPSYRLKATNAHDVELTAVGGSSLARRLGIGEFVLTGDQEYPSTTDPCVLFTDPVTEWGGDAHGGVTLNLNQANAAESSYWTKTVVVAHSRIITTEDRVLGMRALELLHIPPEVNQPRGSRIWGATVGDYCYIKRANAPVPDATALQTVANNEKVKEDDGDRAKIRTALALANDARGTIVLCADALSLLRATGEMIDFHRRGAA